MPSAVPMKFKAEPQRILLVLPTWVGDVVMSTPFIASLHQRFPDAQISLLMVKTILILIGYFNQ